MHEIGSGGMASMRFARKPLRRIEILGLIIFILMAGVMLAVGALLFCDWLDAPASAPAGSPADPGPVLSFRSIAGAIPLIPLVVGVEVAGALSLTVLYLVSALRRRK
jgi:multicomponent Na+:H+ antiporter subunit B